MLIGGKTYYLPAELWEHRDVTIGDVYTSTRISTIRNASKHRMFLGLSVPLLHRGLRCSLKVVKDFFLSYVLKICEPKTAVLGQMKDMDERST